MSDKPRTTDETQRKKGEQKMKLSSALRDNLKRRKAAPRPKKPIESECKEGSNRKA